MMMVPRAYLFTPVTPSKASSSSDKACANDSKDGHGNNCMDKKALPSIQIPDVNGSSDVDQDATLHSNPVVIPPKRGLRAPSSSRRPLPRTRSRSSRDSEKRRRSSSTATLPTPVASILEATAIPVPRKNRTSRESRKLPCGNYVEDFSKLLMEGVESKDGGDHIMDAASGSSSGALGLLLSPPEEDNEKLAANNDDDAVLPSSPHSMSSESTPSLEHDMESPCSPPQPTTPPMNNQRSPSERRCRQLAQREDCAFDHPLLDNEGSLETEQEIEAIREETDSAKSAAFPFRPFPRFGATFKSNLTASLRAIKSAAHTVSTFTTPSVQPDDFLTRSFFTITPELTDDRRPPPMSEPPSPALRRYLNPTTISPAEMHIYHEHPHDPTDPPNKCPVSIQMQTYRRSGNREKKKRRTTSAAQARNCQSTSELFSQAIPRQREARENGDFLRMVVLEMNMRRSGKLRDDIPIRARIWLPPRRSSASCADYSDDDEGSTVPTRWAGVSIDWE